MFELPIHVIDFEGSRHSGIVEYGLVTLQNGKIVDTRTRICEPGGTITNTDRRLHGISEETAMGNAPFEQEWPLFADLRENGPFCAHNSLVEEFFLRMVWPAPRRSPDFSTPDHRTSTWGPWLDTLHIYRQVYPHLKSYKLQSLIQLFDLQETLDSEAAAVCPTRRSHYHCALYDALASALLLKRLGDEPELKAASLSWFFVQSAASNESRDSMMQQKLL